jgi:CCR4-NOT complex subunit CAF16
MGGFEIQGRGESGNSRLGELVLGWLRDDLAERGPRNRGVGSEGKAYFSPGLGGYGAEDSRKMEGGDKKGW